MYRLVWKYLQICMKLIIIYVTKNLMTWYSFQAQHHAIEIALFSKFLHKLNKFRGPLAVPLYNHYIENSILHQC